MLKKLKNLFSKKVTLKNLIKKLNDVKKIQYSY